MNPAAVTFLLGLSIILTIGPYLSEPASDMCTDVQNLPFLQRNVRLPEAEILTMTTDGITSCARNCLNRKWCKSFNFNSSSSECELNHAGPNPGSLNETHLVAEQGYIFSDVKHWPQRLAGACANHNCSFNSYCHPVEDNDYTCIVYVKPTSCAEVKECDLTSSDGEYWIRLVNFDLYRTRIYCHNMSSDTPIEYLTLPNPNYGIYPQVSDQFCTGEETGLSYNCEGKGGETWYHKIKVDLEAMHVDRGDMTFANFTNYKTPYAEAVDCYSEHDDDVLSSCGTRGRFTVDLTGTGWAVPPEQKWKIDGYKAIIESVTRNDEGTIVQMKCGGFGGSCLAKEPFLLVPYPEGKQLLLYPIDTTYNENSVHGIL